MWNCLPVGLSSLVAIALFLASRSLNGTAEARDLVLKRGRDYSPKIAEWEILTNQQGCIKTSLENLNNILAIWLVGFIKVEY